MPPRNSYEAFQRRLPESPGQAMQKKIRTAAQRLAQQEGYAQNGMSFAAVRDAVMGMKRTSDVSDLSRFMQEFRKLEKAGEFQCIRNTQFYRWTPKSTA